MTQRRQIRLIVGLFCTLAVISTFFGWTIHVQREKAALNDALINAVKNGDDNAVIRLLVKGANANARERDDSQKGQPSTLVDFCKQVVAMDYWGAQGTDTALMLASSDGRLAIVKMLVEAKADVNAHSAYGWTPFLRAVCNFNGATESVMIYLAEHGANLTATTEDGMTAGQWAKGNQNYIKALAQATAIQKARARQ